MAIRSSIYNNADIGQGFSNLAQLFAPPSAQDAAAYATAQALRDKNRRLQYLFDNPNDPNFDRENIAVGNYAPTSSFYAQDQNNSTTRRGQDITAATSRANNAADNARAFAQTRFGALNQGQMLPAVPGSIASQFGLPEAQPVVQGNPIPLSETQWQAKQNQRLLDTGALNDQNLVDVVLGKETPVQTVGANGKPTFMSPGEAVRTGAPAYVNAGAAAKPTNAVAVLRDGTEVPAVQAPDGTWHHAQTGAELPADIRVFDLPKAQGTAEQVGLAKPTNNYVQQQLVDIASTVDTAVKLRDMIAKAPASQGAVGFLRGTAQNVIESGSELGQFFGGQVAQVANDIKKKAADADLAGDFDPQIPAIDMMANLLAFQYAKTMTGQRLSNQMLQQAKKALGLEGLDANQANSLARLDTAIQQLQSQEAVLRKALAGGVDAVQTNAPDTVTAAGIPSADAPPGVDPEDWKYLTPEEKAQYLGQ